MHRQQEMERRFFRQAIFCKPYIYVYDLIRMDKEKMALNLYCLIRIRDEKEKLLKKIPENKLAVK